ncbi:N-formyl peptide receptor 2 [Nycticebus coucang]|uniref:N-formyl peptide receptor 2 n=1 Tax=Nycticebus coucang TaxID=9470 RepID=UPI00234C99D2|nr:N-formyl peptide receptor 2 [Nycticebus coucang]
METNISLPLDGSEEPLHESAGYTPLLILSLVVLGVTFVFGLLGNGLVIWVAGYRMAHTVTTISYLNLAVADFSFSAIVPFYIVSRAMEEKWPFGWFLCKLVPILGDINLYGSIFLIAFIALDRCICVLHPVWAQNHRTLSLAKKVIIVPWILAIILTMPTCIFQGTVTTVEGETYCIAYIESWGNNTEETLELASIVGIVGGTIRFVVGFIMPMSIVAICYGLVIAKLHKRGTIKSSRTLRVLTTVVASFFICWFPFQLIALLITIWFEELLLYGKYKILEMLLYPTSALSFFNSCLNPILYVFVGRDFRKTLIRSLPASLERALMEDLALTEDTATDSAVSPAETELGAM